jgi:ABC-type spermidine/putrescine transport system permease subunit I
LTGSLPETEVKPQSSSRLRSRFATQPPALIYNTAFRANRFGEAAAVGILLLATVLTFSAFYFRVTRPTQEIGE